MKKIVVMLGAGILSLGIAGTTWMLNRGEAQSVPILNHATVTWDAVTTDVNGNPETIRDAELGIWPAGADRFTVPPLAVLSALPGTPPVGGVQIAGLIAGRPDGDYQLAVRVYDLAGNSSAWSSALVGRYDMTPPSKPGGFRIVVTVNVELIPETK